MNLSKYQSQVVYDAIGYSDLNHALHALVVSVGELSRWSSVQMSRNVHCEHVDPNNDKFAAYIGHVWYNLAIIAVLLGIPLEALELYSKIVDAKGRHFSYWTLKLVGTIGDLHRVYVKYVESNGTPSIKEIHSMHKWEYGDNIRSQLADQCVLVMHLLYRLQASLHLATESVLENDIVRRYNNERD